MVPQIGQPISNDDAQSMNMTKGGIGVRHNEDICDVESAYAYIANEIYDAKPVPDGAEYELYDFDAPVPLNSFPTDMPIEIVAINASKTMDHLDLSPIDEY